MAEGFPLIMEGVTGLPLLCTLCDATREEPYSNTRACCSAGEAVGSILLHTCTCFINQCHVHSPPWKLFLYQDPEAYLSQRKAA